MRMCVSMCVLGRGAVVALAMAMVCGGCSRRVYVPVERVVVRHDTVMRGSRAVDSVLVRDSVTVVERGDTVTVTRWRERERVRVVTDTALVVRHDTVRTDVTGVAAAAAAARDASGSGRGRAFAWGAVAALVAALGAALLWRRRR